MPELTTPHVLDTALSCFAERGLEAATIDWLTDSLGCSHRKLYTLLGNKATLIEAVYTHALAQLLTDDPTRAQPSERLQQHLSRWWRRTAAAHANPRAFAFWLHYRAQASRLTPLPLGPFSAVPDLLAQVFARPGFTRPVASLSLALGAQLLAAQWTATVQVLLAEAAEPVSAAQSQRVLDQAFSSWWQSTGWPTSTHSWLPAGGTSKPSLLGLLGQAWVEQQAKNPAKH